METVGTLFEIVTEEDIAEHPIPVSTTVTVYVPLPTIIESFVLPLDQEIEVYNSAESKYNVVGFPVQLKSGPKIKGVGKGCSMTFTSTVL